MKKRKAAAFGGCGGCGGARDLNITDLKSILPWKQRSKIPLLIQIKIIVYLTVRCLVSKRKHFLK